jgi:hypothetical protein
MFDIDPKTFYLYFSTNKTDCHNITEILLKVVLNTITPLNSLITPQQSGADIGKDQLDLNSQR